MNNKIYIGDISHYQPDIKLVDLQVDLSGVIHKATEGIDGHDPYYFPREFEVLQTKLLWGAYHFGLNGDPVGQAHFFLDAVKPTCGTLIALDLEQRMSLQEAETFVTTVRDELGRFPLVYVSKSYMNEIDPFPHSKLPTVLSQCGLWVANYSNCPIIPTQWSYYDLWQYSDGILGGDPIMLPHTPKIDLSVWRGNKEELIEWWGRC
jgi:lysozyme